MSKKPIAVFITDTHLGEDNSEAVLEVYRQSLDVVRQYGLKELYHLGDHFTNRVAQRLRTLLTLKKISSMLYAADIDLCTIAGNHDKTDQSSAESYLDLYDYAPITVFKGDPDPIHVTDDIDFHMLPFFTDDVYAEKLSAIQKSMDTSKKNVLLTHFGLSGVLNNDGFKGESVIDSGRYRAFDLTLIGHYHNYNKVTNKIHYIGSTDARNYGEDSNKGCVLLFDDLSMERIKFKFKEYKKIVIDKFEDFEIQKFIEKYKNSEDNIRFEFKGTDEDFLKIDKKKINSLGIEVTTSSVNSVLVNEEGEEEAQPTIGMTKVDILKSFAEYCKKNGVEKKKSAKVLKYFK